MKASIEPCKPAIVAAMPMKVPISCGELAVMTGMGVPTVAALLRNALKNGLVVKAGTRSELRGTRRHYQTIQLWMPRKTPLTAKKATMEDKGMTLEDYQWMAYWKEHHRQRMGS